MEKTLSEVERAIEVIRNRFPEITNEQVSRFLVRAFEVFVENPAKFIECTDNLLID